VQGVCACFVCAGRGLGWGRLNPLFPPPLSRASAGRPAMMQMASSRIDRLEILVDDRERRALWRMLAIFAIAAGAMAILIGFGIARLGSFDSAVHSLGVERRQAEQARDAARSTVVDRDKQI